MIDLMNNMAKSAKGGEERKLANFTTGSHDEEQGRNATGDVFGLG